MLHVPFGFRDMVVMFDQVGYLLNCHGRMVCYSLAVISKSCHMCAIYFKAPAIVFAGVLVTTSLPIHLDF